MATMPIPTAICAYIYYNAEFNILCCKVASCLQALEPKSAARHYAEEHHLSLALRKIIANYIEEKGELSSKRNQIHPQHGLPPQQFIQIHRNLYQCKRCLLVKKHPKSIRQHLNNVHFIKKFKLEEESITVAAQTWYSGTQAVYWQVQEPFRSDSEENTGSLTSRKTPLASQHTNNVVSLPVITAENSEMIAKMVKAEELQVEQEHQQRLHLAERHNPDSISPWLRMTGWLQVFAAIPTPLQELAKLVEPPAKEEVCLVLLEEIFTDFIVPRCIQTLQNTPHPYLTWLASPQETVDQPKPFSELQARESLKKYMRYWVQYICYIIRSLASEELLDLDSDTDNETDSENESLQPSRRRLKELLDLESGLHLTCWQHTCVSRIHLMAAKLAHLKLNDLEEYQKEQIGAQLLHFCHLSIRQQLHLQSPYKSSLMHFLAHMGINTDKNTLRTSQEYTGILAGVLYISRLLILEYSLSVTGWPSLKISAFSAKQLIDHDLVSEDTPVNESSMKKFQAERCNWLVQGKNTPISTLLRQLAYGKMINRIQGRPATVTWNLSLTRLYHKEHPIDIQQFKAAVGNIISDAKQVLKKLLLGVQAKIEMDQIHDTISSTGLWGKTGFNFTCHPVNKFKGALESMLHQAARQTNRYHLLDEHTFARENAADNEEEISYQQVVRWKKKPCKDYLKQEREFLDLLMIAIHLTGGQPARGPEIGSFKHSNGLTSSRNVYVLNGLVAIVTQYDKNLAKRGKTHYIVRYLPENVSQLLVQYMVWVRPLAICIERQIVPNYNVQRDGSTTSRNEYLWIGSKDPFSDRYVNKLFNKILRQYLGLALNISEYRHIAIAIAREFLQPHLSVLGIDPETGAAADENANDIEVEHEGNMVLDLQAAHSTRTAEMAYAVDARFLNQLSGRLLRQFLQASISWHEWLGLGASTIHSESKVLAKRGRSESTTLQLPLSATEKRRTSINLLPAQDTVTSADIKGALQSLYGHQAVFRSEAQAKSAKYLATLQPGRNSSSVHILGTGQGKSVFFFLLAALTKMQVVLVVVPYVALIGDLLSRAQYHKVDAIQWTSGTETSGASLVFVSADLVMLPGFIQYCHILAAHHQLKHIFLDECHVSLTDTGYRKNLKYLKNLRLIDAPLACLTATLPPALEAMLVAQLCLGKATIIRSSTTQKNIQYLVKDCHKKQLFSRVVEHVQQTKLSREAEELGVVFVRSVEMGERLAEELECPFYYSQAQDKQSKLSCWNTNEHQWIVATGALGTGMDIAGIREVVHLDRPYGMISYVQQAGRGGRNDFTSVATLYINVASLKPRNSDSLLSAYSVESIDEEALTTYMTSTICRRVCISQYLDGQANTGTCLVQSLLPCDICSKQIKEMPAEDTAIIAAESDIETTLPHPSIDLPNTSLPSTPLGFTEVTKVGQQKATDEKLRCKFLQELSSSCIYCRTEHETIDESHKYASCPLVDSTSDKQNSYTNYRIWRKGLRFPHYQACFTCGLDQHECGRDIAAKEACSHGSIAFEYVFLLSKQANFMAYISKNMYTGSGEADFCRWLTSSCSLKEDISWLAYILTISASAILDSDSETELA